MKWHQYSKVHDGIKLIMNFHSKLLHYSFCRGESNLILLTEKEIIFWCKDEELFISVFLALIYYFYPLHSLWDALMRSIYLSLPVRLFLSLSLSICPSVPRYLSLSMSFCLSLSFCLSSSLSLPLLVRRLAYIHHIWNDNWKHSLSMMTAITHEINIW